MKQASAFLVCPKCGKQTVSPEAYHRHMKKSHSIEKALSRTGLVTAAIKQILGKHAKI